VICFFNALKVYQVLKCTEWCRCSVVLQWDAYKWIEKFENDRINLWHEDGARLASEGSG